MFDRKLRFASCGLVLSAVAGCNGFGDLSVARFVEPEVPDVHPIRRARADEAVAEFDHKRNEAQYLAAKSSWRQGDYPRCRESLDKVLDRDPNHRASLLLLADVALETDKPDEAVATLRRLTALDPQDAEAAYRLGLALETADQVAEAVPYLRQAAKAEPQNAKYVDALRQAEHLVAGTNRPAPAQAPAPPVALADERFAAALADWEAGREADAAKKVAAFLTAQPDHVDANILQAEIDVAAGRTKAAIERMEKLAAGRPTDPQVCQAFGLILAATGDHLAAAQYFTEAKRLAVAQARPADSAEENAVLQATFVTPADDGEPPTAPAELNLPGAEPRRLDVSQWDPAELLRQGEAALGNKQLDEADRLLHAAIDHSADDVQTALAATVAPLKLEQPELSYRLASHAVVRFPHSAGLHRVRGMAAYRLRRYAEAEAALRQSVSLDNSQALSYFLLGSALHHLGRPEEGERYRSEAARLDARYALRK
jgi:predicted Zn-dependent protease